MSPFGLSDIKRTIPGAAFARAERYVHQGRVRDVGPGEEADTLIGHVQGTERKPYEQHIRIVGGGQHRHIIGWCSCPVGANCKHVGAVLLAALHQSDTKPTSNGSGPVAVMEPDLERWLDNLEAASAPEPTNDYPPEIQQRLIYVLDTEGAWQTHPPLSLQLYSVRLLKNGNYGGRPSSYTASNAFNHPPAKFLRPNDLMILQDLCRHRALSNAIGSGHRLEGEVGAGLLEQILRTGRCRWQSLEGPILKQGEPRLATARWQTSVDGRQRPIFEIDAAAGIPATVLPLTPPHYVDRDKGEIGIIETGMPARLANAFARAPMVKPSDVPKLVSALENALPDQTLPMPVVLRKQRRKDIEPRPHLRLTTACLDYRRTRYWATPTSDMAAIARLSFDYESTRVGAADKKRELSRIDGSEIVSIVRRTSEEKVFRTRLEDLGFERIDEVGLYDVTPEHRGDFIMIGPDPEEDLLDPERALLEFSYHHLPVLRAEGWTVEVDDDYPVHIAEAGHDWFADVREGSGIDWFGVELGIMVDGKRISVLPLLLDLLESMQFGAGLGDLEALTAGDVTFVPLQDGRLVPLDSERLRPLLAALFELFEMGAIDEDGSLRLNPMQAADLADLAAATEAINLRWLGGERLLELGARLRNAGQIKPVEPPSGFKGLLRFYQKEGLSWLQFLREVELGGILADDMGLGKTVQTLAHILVEKRSGRADRPSLVVAPTSLMANWRLEAQRFAPDLKVLTLHGSERKQHFDDIEKHDLVLTTYALLRYDKDVLLGQDYHLVILDEAQNIKNPKAAVTRLVHQLKARHRLCLTGTPLENHLGELWSLCHFLNPGLLGDSQTFRRVFRTPIEKHDNVDRSRQLARRVQPFLLRRTKAEVEQDLPEKTEIVENIELAGDQRDLYESIRLAMHERVRREIAAKGAGRSHIIILDALLKLRQVCCDPRLLKLDAAKKIEESAKLERLMDMLTAMIEEGRRILLFSQFTSMLTLIEAELKKLKLGYLKLTGRTKDRGALVEEFQNGTVPLFLISLKAGGSGLNLTAADTVIHYDPWWNPAVEDQATDRAHRIGQDKPVFVYKLRTLGTVEEKIQELQARKRSLADGLFETGGKAITSLDAEGIAALFAPIDG
ncbi:MAG: DEAD/DEAH box helicase [Alphaproteobacteria bacterium]|nr:DEAD/DEAH box helicase [Alphaproteobacteria bacterium]